jgi:protein-S-isoprenylcysteine O-methyltransferase
MLSGVATAAAVVGYGAPLRHLALGMPFALLVALALLVELWRQLREWRTQGVRRFADLLAARGGPGTVRADRGSLWLLYAGIAVAVGALWMAWATGLGVAALPEGAALALTALALVLMLLGVVVRAAAIWALGRFFTARVMLHQDQRLITVGPYRWVRHPSYTGGALFFLGLALASLDGLTLLVVGLALGSAFTYRIAVEERALRQRFGAAYDAYTRKTWRLIPCVY